MSRLDIATSTPASDPSADVYEQLESADPPNRDEFERWLDETMTNQLERHHVPDAAVVVFEDRDPLLAKGYGFAGLESSRPVVVNENVFSIGSTGTLVTWTAVMQGVEDGRLNRDRDVNDYLSGSAAGGRISNPTQRDAVNHSAVTPHKATTVILPCNGKAGHEQQTRARVTDF